MENTRILHESQILCFSVVWSLMDKAKHVYWATLHLLKTMGFQCKSTICVQTSMSSQHCMMYGPCKSLHNLLLEFCHLQKWPLKQYLPLLLRMLHKSNREQNSTARDLRKCQDVSVTLTCSLCHTFLFSVYYFVKYLSYYWLEAWQYKIFLMSIYHAPVTWHFVVVGGSVSDTCLSHSFLNSFSLLIHTSQSLKLSIPRCCHCNEPAFAPYDQYPYSLYSFQYIFLGTEKENLFSNQRF